MSNPGGKGSGRRPSSVSGEEFRNNWEAIFGKKEVLPKASKEERDELIQNLRGFGISVPESGRSSFAAKK